MRKQKQVKFILMLAAGMLISNFNQLQAQWLGGGGTSTPIYRPGDVGIGMGTWIPHAGMNLEVHGEGSIGHLKQGSFSTYTTNDQWLSFGPPPSGALDFYGQRGTWGGNYMYVGQHNSGGSTNGLIGWGNIEGGNRLKFSFFNGSNGGIESEKMTILSSGNVGIGTSSPAKKLQVNALVTGSDFNPESDGDVIAMFKNPHPYSPEELSKNFDASISVSNYFANAMLRVRDGNVYVGSRDAQNGANGKLYLTAGDAVTAMTLNNAGLVSVPGNVTIGSVVSPTEKLEVGGNIKSTHMYLTNNLYLNNSFRIGDGGDELNIENTTSLGVTLNQTTGHFSARNGFTSHETMYIGDPVYHTGYRYIFHIQEWLNNPDFLSIAPEDPASPGTFRFDRAITLHNDGRFNIKSLSGTGNRMLIVEPDGDVAAQPIGSGDNLGNHSMSQNLNTNGHWLSGNGTSAGININSSNHVDLSGNLTTNGVTKTSQVIIGLASSSSKELFVGGNAEVSANLTTSSFIANGNTTLANTTINATTSASDINPKNDNAFDLGGSGLAWREIFSNNAVTVTSDRNAKKDIEDLNYGIEDIMNLRAVSYRWNENDNGVRLGFIAQELENTLEEVVVNENGRYGVRYTEIIPVLVKGIQDQQNIIVEQDAQIEGQNAKIAELENAISEIRAAINCQTPQPQPKKEGVKTPNQMNLRPNPTSSRTTVDYTIVQEFTNAKVEVYNSVGQQIGTYNISSEGTGNIEIDTATWASGTYICKLVVDNNVQETKKLVVSK